MLAWIITMVVILIVALAAIGTVAVGMRGAGKERHPLVAHRFAQAARHLNGDAKAPQAFVDLLPAER
ncbi:MAG TPA: hypothetical protein PKN27_04125 [Propionibacteriaceae bacterium]|nr:hypothetical protein [Propionibacteriaceae bacterium]